MVRAEAARAFAWMREPMKMRCMLMAAALALGAALCAWGGAVSELRPEWSVGQEAVSPALLAVTPPAPAPASLTIREAVTIALARNSGFRVAISNLLAAASNLRVAQQRWSLEVVAGHQRTQDGTSFVGGANFDYAALSGADFQVATELNRVTSEEANDSLTATFNQPLLAGAGKASPAYQALRAARNAYRSALLGYFQARQDTIAQVISAYFAAVQQKQVVGIQKESVQLAEQAVKDAQVRYDEGMIIEIDVLRAKQRLATAQAGAIEADRSAQSGMDQLMLVLGLQVGGDPTLTTEVDYQPAPLNLEASVRQALQLRPDLCQAQIAIEDREAAVLVARSLKLPELNLFGGMGHFTGGDVSTDWNVGIQATVPIGAVGLQEAYRQSQWALLLARQNLLDLRQQVTADVRSQVRAADAARQDVDLADQAVGLSERSLTQARRLVEEDLGTNRDVLDAQEDLTRSKIALVDSKINYYLAGMRLKVATGVDVATVLPPAGRPTPAAAPAVPAASTAPATPAPKTGALPDKG